MICSTISTSNSHELAVFSEDQDAWNKAKLNLMGDCFRYHYERYEAQGGRPEDVIMPLIYTSEEDDEISVSRTNTNYWYKGCRALFIGRSKQNGKWNDSFDGINDPSDDAQWQKYIQGFEVQGYCYYQEAAQTVYDKTWGVK